MTTNTEPTTATAKPKAQRSFPASWMAAVGIGGAWIAVATAETLLMNGQDALNDVGMIGEDYANIAAAGLLHWAGAMLLIVGLAGSASLVWGSKLGRVGWFLTTTLAAGLGAFSMVHLLALETAAANLDPAAMNTFLIERLGEGSGPWTIPILFVGLLGPWSLTLFLVGLVRVRRIHWLSPTLLAVGAAAHMVLTGEIFESVSIWMMAAGAVLAAYGILRSRTRSSEDAAK